MGKLTRTINVTFPTRMKTVAAVLAVLAAGSFPARAAGWGDRINGNGNGNGRGQDRKAGDKTEKGSTGDKSGGDRSFGSAPVPKPEPVDPNSPYKLADYDELLNRNLFSRFQKRRRGEMDPDEAARLQELRDARAAESNRKPIIPNYDKDIVLMGIVDRDSVITGILEDRHANKTVFVKAGEKLGSGKVGAITLDSLEFIAGTDKTVKIAYGRNLEGGYSEAKPIDPPQFRKGDMPGEEGLSAEERMKRKRMREMGIPVPELRPQVSADSNTNNNDQDDQDLTPEERFRRDFARRAAQFQEGFQQQGGFVPPNFQNFQPPNPNQTQGQGGNTQYNPTENRDRRQDYQQQDRRQDFQQRDRRQDYQQRDTRQDVPQRDTRQDYQQPSRGQDVPRADQRVAPEDANLSVEERMKRKRERELNGDAAPAAKPADAPRAENKSADDANLSVEERLKRKRQQENNPDF